MSWYNPFTWIKPRTPGKSDAAIAPVQKGFRFTALRDFTTTDTRSQYVEGMIYTVRPGNHRLAALVDQWVADGRVRIGGQASRVSGRAKVN